MFVCLCGEPSKECISPQCSYGFTCSQSGSLLPFTFMQSNNIKQP